MKITVNHIEIHYRVVGAGHPLILLHGNGEDHHIFDKLIHTLSADYTIYALDLRGHGTSQKLPQLYLQDMVEDLVAFCQQLKLKKPYVYGFSDGGVLGLMLASQYPQLLGKLIVSGANLSPQGLHVGIRLVSRGAQFFKHHPEWQMLTQPHLTATDLKKITIPTLVTAGGKDIVKISHTRYIADCIPNSKLMIFPREHHSSYVVDSFKLLPVIKAFCSRQEATTEV